MSTHAPIEHERNATFVSMRPPAACCWLTGAQAETCASLRLLKANHVPETPIRAAHNSLLDSHLLDGPGHFPQPSFARSVAASTGRPRCASQPAAPAVICHERADASHLSGRCLAHLSFSGKK